MWSLRQEAGGYVTWPVTSAGASEGVVGHLPQHEQWALWASALVSTTGTK